jgi:hypothetical protein
MHSRERQRDGAWFLNFTVYEFPSLGDEVRNGPRGEAQLFHARGRCSLRRQDGTLMLLVLFAPVVDCNDFDSIEPQKSQRFFRSTGPQQVIMAAYSCLCVRLTNLLLSTRQYFRNVSYWYQEESFEMDLSPEVTVSSR